MIRQTTQLLCALLLLSTACLAQQKIGGEYKTVPGIPFPVYSAPFPPPLSNTPYRPSRQLYGFFVNKDSNNVFRFNRAMKNIEPYAKMDAVAYKYYQRYRHSRTKPLLFLIAAGVLFDGALTYSIYPRAQTSTAEAEARDRAIRPVFYVGIGSLATAGFFWLRKEKSKEQMITRLSQCCSDRIGWYYRWK